MERKARRKFEVNVESSIQNNLRRKILKDGCHACM
jgi:hypothetical protein